MVGINWLLDINFGQFYSTVLEFGNAQTHIDKFLVVLFILYQHLLNCDSRLHFTDHH